MPTANKLLIVDGHAYAYRSFYAIRHLNSPSGAPTNAIYGFIKTLEKQRAVLAPTHAAVVWDGGLDAQRVEAHPEYKAQRPPMPAGLEQQIDGIVAYLQATGVASFCRDGVEADDWIARMARRLAEGASVVIASSDKDFMQLVSPRIGLLNPNDKSEKIWTDADVRAKAGVAPGQIVDWLSLIGDSVDNIPGVPGIGPKTASELLNQFGSIEALYARLGEVKSERHRASLQAAASAVRRNQELIRLRDDLPDVPLEEVVLREPDEGRLRELFGQWGFKRMLAALTPEPVQKALI
jgi:DNA polymerase-1